MGRETSQLAGNEILAKSSAELLRLALAVGDLGLWQWDHARDTVVLDDRAAAMLGLAAAGEECPVSRLITLVHPDDVEPVRNEITAYLAGGKPIYELEMRQRRPAGGWVWLRLKGCPVEQDGARPVRTVGTITDFTEQQQREEERRQAAKEQADAARRFDLILRASGQGIWDWDLRTNQFTTNEAYWTMLGYPAATGPFPASAWSDLLHPDDVAPTWQHVQDVLEQPGVDYRVEFRVRRRDQGYRWVRAAGQVMERDEAGNALRMMGVHVDVDGHRREISERRRLQRLLQQAVDTIPQRVWWKDCDGRYLGANRALLRDACLKSPDDLVGLTDADTVWAMAAGKIAADDRRVVESGEPMLGLVERLATPGGKYRWVRTNKVPLRDDDGQVIGTLGTYEDITSMQELQEQLCAARDAAEAANLAKSEFLARMSHEIRTPMNGVIGMTQLALDTELNGFQRDCLETVRASADSLLTIINDILDFSKIEARQMVLSPAPFSIRQLAHRVTSLLDPRAREKGLDLRAFVDPGVPEVLIGDDVRLGQVLTNLLGNAVKFTPLGGRVQLGIRLISSVERAVMLGITVSDSGIGIPAESLGRIFEPFRQADDGTSRRYGGTGLGLSICKQLVEMMDGRISVESTVGTGTTFSFTCRLGTGANALPEEPLPVPVEAAEGAPLRVMLVEDHPVNLKLARHLLEKENCRVVTALNGLEAVRLVCAALLDPYDLILMDCHMPEMNGWDATMVIRDYEARHGLAPTPIVALTANALEGDREQCLDAGMDEYLSKPIDRRKLAALLAHYRALRGTQGLSPAQLEESQVH